jgi:hypothetical protein
MRPDGRFRPAPRRRGSLARLHPVPARTTSRRRIQPAAGGSRLILPAHVQPSLPTAQPNPSRINTSANLSFFIKSLIMNDLKSNRISKRANKSPRISTSGHYGCKSSRINTSRNHPGEGGSTIRVSGSTARRSRRLLADTPGCVPVSPAAANG